MEPTNAYKVSRVNYVDKTLAYRVSTKSFPDNKHLLQENYVEYKHILLPLLKSISKILYHVFIVTFLTFGFCMQHFQTRGLGEMVRNPGHHDRRISPPLTSFYGVCFRHQFPDITNLKARITDALATITEDMLENTLREIGYRLDVLRATKGAHVEVY